MSKLVLIDGNAIMHRAFHALPKTFTTKEGKLINAVYGFTSMILKIITDLEPTHLAVAFDRKEPTFRKVEFEDYQSHRPETDEGLSSQFPRVKKILSAMRIPYYEKVRFEADDVIGTIAKKTKVDAAVIVTGDRDILQLVDGKIKVYLPIKGLSNAKLVDEEEVIEMMGVRADQIVDYKGLVGDPSDNYKGVPGIGPKTAEKLLKEYGSFKAVYKNIKKIEERISNKLKKHKKSADMSFKLAKIITDVDIKYDLDDMNDWSVYSSEAVKVFEKYRFKSLQKRAMKMAGKSINEKPSRETIKDAALKIVRLLGNREYAFRGTTSLILQGVDMNIDDIDIICDKKTSLLCNDILAEHLLEKVEYKETDKFKSYFGRFVVGGVLVEVMGEWQIQKAKGGWSRMYNASKDQITAVSIKGKKIPVTKIETELSMFSDMGRWSAYHKIKRQLEKKNQMKLI